mmetsp:Transcript_17685/g.15600  ORF Transcript_17685/g.15600 Transcript_17685/m.15600 type:complete len:95 (+) Transcript_17685:156-440(+)
MQSSHVIKTLPEVDVEQLEKKKIFLPYKGSNDSSATSVNCECRKTIIFDMDETLVHKVDASDMIQDADISVEVHSEDNSHIFQLGFNIRPFAIE